MRFKLNENRLIFLEVLFGVGAGFILILILSITNPNDLGPLILLLSFVLISFFISFRVYKLRNSKLKSAKEIAESKLKQYTFLKLDKQLISSIRQYLVFFSNYVKDSKQVDITMHASEVEGGLDIAFDFPETTTKEELQTWLDEYLGFLTTDKEDFQVNTVEEVTNEQTDVLILKLKNQVQHFKHSLDILRVENSLLKSQNEQISDITKLLASKSDQIFISTGNNSSVVKEQINTSDKTQFIGNSFHKSEINISEIDDRIVELIKEFSKNNKEEKKLLSSLETLKSEKSSEKEKKKSGSMIRKFLETCNAEVAKEVIKAIAKNGEGWIQYIGDIFIN